MDEVTLNVRASTGDHFVVKAMLDQSVAQLKSKIQEQSSIPSSQQRLIYKGQVLEDQHPLSFYAPEDGQTVHLVRDSGDSSGSATSSSTVSNAPTHSAARRRDSGSAAVSPFGGLEQLPWFQSLISNPEIIRTAMTFNPALRSLMERNPEIARALEDPQTLQQIAAVMRNPSLMNQMTSMSDRAMSNLDTVPGGMDALARLYRDFQLPFQEACDEAVSSMTNSSSTSTSTSAASNSEGGSPLPPRSGPPNSEPLPNPWAPRSSPAWSSGNPFNPYAFQTAPIQPHLQQQQWGNSFPFFFPGFGSTPANTVQTLNTPAPGMDANQNQFLQQMMQMFSNWQTQAQNPSLATGSGVLRTTAQAPSQAPSSTSPVTQSEAHAESSEETPPEAFIFEKELAELAEMGFTDTETARAALRDTKGDVLSALERLLGTPL